MFGSKKKIEILENNVEWLIKEVGNLKNKVNKLEKENSLLNNYTVSDVVDLIMRELKEEERRQTNTIQNNYYSPSKKTDAKISSVSTSKSYTPDSHSPVYYDTYTYDDDSSRNSHNSSHSYDNSSSSYSDSGSSYSSSSDSGSSYSSGGDF